MVPGNPAHARRFLLLAVLLVAGASVTCLFASGAANAADQPKRLLRFVQMSDAHFVMPEDKANVKDFGTRELSRSTDSLQGATKFIAGELKPDFVICTGDMVENGGWKTGVQAMRKAKEMIEAAAPRAFFIYGNHEVNEDNFREVFGASNYTFRCGSLQFVALQANGGFPRLDRVMSLIPKHVVYQLDDLLATCEGNVILMLHDPLVCGGGEEGWARPENHMIVNNVLARHGNVAMVLQGHTHFYFHERLNDIEYLICPGMADNGDKTTGLGHNVLVYDVYEDRIECSAYGAKSTDDAAAGKFVKSTEINVSVPLKRKFGGANIADVKVQPLPTPAPRYDAEIEKAMRGAALILSSGWKTQEDFENRGLELNWHLAEFDDAAWQAHKGFRNYWTHADKPKGFIWYRGRFKVPEHLKGEALEVVFGRVFDCDETYLNGQLVGRTGTTPPGQVDLAPSGRSRVYVLPNEHLRYGKDNVLAVRVYDEGDRGGIRDIPIVRFADEDAGAKTAPAK